MLLYVLFSSEKDKLSDTLKCEFLKEKIVILKHSYM